MGVKISRVFFVIILLSLFFIPLFSAEPPKPQPVPTNVPGEKKVIYYVFEDSKGLYQIGMMGINGEEKKALTSQGNNWSPAVSTDGKRVAFYSDRSGAANLWVMNTDGSLQSAVTEENEDIANINLYTRGQIAWIKDKKEIYFIKKGNLWMIDETGTGGEDLTKVFDVTMFRFSPDYAKIIYAREPTAKHNGLHVMLVDGTGMKQVLESEMVTPAFDWGERDTVAFYSDVFVGVMSGSGVSRKNVLKVVYPDNDIEWAKMPDGKSGKIAYKDAGEKGPEIWLVDPDKGDKKQVTDRGGNSPCWFNDGVTIAYVQGLDIYRLNTETKQKKRLTYHFRSYFPVFAVLKTDVVVEPPKTEAPKTK